MVGFKYSESFNKRLNTVQPVLRVVQLLASIVGLILWAVHLSRLPNSNGANLRAVLGVFVAGTLWVIMGIAQYAWRRRSEKGNKTRWGVLVGVALFVAALDFCFIILFATAAGLTGPSSSARADGVCYVDEDLDSNIGIIRTGDCGQVQGVFALSILNVITHSGSAITNFLQGGQQPPNPKGLMQNPLKQDEA